MTTAIIFYVTGQKTHIILLNGDGGIMENLIRVSDILVFDARTRNKKKSFNIEDVILSHNGYVSGIITSGKGIFSIKRYVASDCIEKISV